MTNIPPQVLIPFDIREAISIGEAAKLAGRTPMTIRSWVSLHDLGRRVGGRWCVSRVALAMHLENDRSGLARYLGGDRESEVVNKYLKRFGLAGLDANSANSH